MVRTTSNRTRTSLLHPDVRKTGIYRRKYHLRAVFQSIAFVTLVGFYCVYNEYVEPSTKLTRKLLRRQVQVGEQYPSLNDNNIQQQYGNNDNLSSSSFLSTISTGTEESNHRRLLEEHNIDCDKFNKNSIDKNEEKSSSTTATTTTKERRSSSLLDVLPKIPTTLSKTQRNKRKLAMQLCSEIDEAEPKWFLVWYCIGVLYMFLALAIVCDEFFVPALEEMAGPNRLNLSMDVAGATLMAAGGSAPELFTSLIGTFQESEVGIGTIVGSAVFNVLFVIAMCALFAKEVLTLTWWPLFRDSAFYAIGLIVLAVFVGVVTKEEILLWEAIVLLGMYFIYIVLMYYNRDIFKMITGKEIVYPDEMDDEDDDDDKDKNKEDSEPTAATNGINGNGDADDNDDGVNGDGIINSKRSNHPNDESEHHMYVGKGWQGTFRAGVLTMIRHPDTWLETAGVAIVAKIEGDVDKVFKDVDLNGDGSIDKEELGMLFAKLDCHLSDEELDKTFQELDTDGNGVIDKDEFTVWYVASEERLISQMKHIFDRFDKDNSNTIDKEELVAMMHELKQDVSEDEINEVMDVMYKHGNPDEITYEEFADWYKSSLLFHHQKEILEEEIEGPCESLKPPFGESIFQWIKYIILLPLVGIMTLTIPNAAHPKYAKWCYLAFFLSIAHIGGYSYLMVWWAEVIGNTAGIPSVVMGLTILAAGTSVPDLLSSVIVARRGAGDMAVSSSIGSNIFDILVGLPVPWILYTAWPTTPSRVEINSENIWISILVLLGMLVFVIAAVHCQGWKLTKLLALMMILFYVAFLVQAIVLEVPFETCIADTIAPSITPTPLFN